MVESGESVRQSHRLITYGTIPHDSTRNYCFLFCSVRQLSAISYQQEEHLAMID
jgi:hypothetical protein